MANVLVIDPEKCTSCRLCELACSARNAGAYRPARSRIRVLIRADEAFYFPRVCIQCEEAPCIEECPTDALVRDAATNVVVLKEDRCDGCGVCESACPYGVIWCLDDKAHKCDLCGGDPECVRFCAPDALRYESQDRWPPGDRQAYADRLRGLVQEVKR
ncbi:MAG TPA: 4Fe-4S dicluster domain-containing protein [Phycisphaerae bacterium]|nr:4Fe-4S dicluster domain-containing protein [Phycisphaerae bacterium]